MRPANIMVLSCCMVLLIIIISGTAISTPGFYASETANWRVQSLGQDWINLFIIVPFLLATSASAWMGSKISWQLWGGAVLYLAYAFAIYCFDVHFNPLFVLYCLEFGLAVYCSFSFLLAQKKHHRQHTGISVPEKATGIYFILIAVSFYGLWLTEILPATVLGTRPESLAVSGLPTNPVHVLDLAVCLPGLFFTGIGILQRRSWARRLIPTVLIFLLLMDLTIGLLAIFMKHEGVSNDASVALLMGALAVFTGGLLLWNIFSRYKTVLV